MTTLSAPASRWVWACSRFVKSPVDSIATWTPSSLQGSAAGSRSFSSFSSVSPTRMPPFEAATSSPSGPSTESYLRRCAIVFASPRSFTATISMSAPCLRAARKKLRPIRPKPLMPNAYAHPSLRSLAPRSSLPRPHFATPRRGGLLIGRPDQSYSPPSGSALVRCWIQTPSDAKVRSAVETGGGGRPRSFPSGPLVSGAQVSARRRSLARRRCSGRPRRRRAAAAGQLGERERRVAHPELGHLAERRVDVLEAARPRAGARSRGAGPRRRGSRGRGSHGRRSRAGWRASASRRRRPPRRSGGPRPGRRGRRAGRRSSPRPSRTRARGRDARRRRASTPSGASPARKRAPSRSAARSSRWALRGPETEPAARKAPRR